MLNTFKEKKLEEFAEHIENLKKSAGEIPENTCPDIDKILKTLNGVRKDIVYYCKQKYDESDELAKDVLYSADDIDVSGELEELREDNSKLRDLGKFWYEECLNMQDFLSSLISDTYRIALEEVEKIIKTEPVMKETISITKLLEDIKSLSLKAQREEE